MAGGTLQGPVGYPPKAAAALTGCLRIGRLQAGIPGLGENPPHGRHATSPLPGDKGAEPRRSHLPAPGMGNVRPRAIQIRPTLPPSSWRKPGSQEAKGSPSIHPNPSFPRRRESISLCGRGRSRTVRGIWIPACAGMTKGRSHPAHRHAVPFGGLRTGLFQHPPRGRRQAAGWIPACADDGAKTVTAIPPPSCQRKLASISYP